MNESASKLLFFNEKKKFFYFFLIMINSIFSFSQPYYELKFGTPMDDRARSMKQMSDGNIFIAGFSNAGPNGGYDIAIAKVSSIGTHLWTQYYGKLIDEYTLYMNLTSDNGLILCGEAHNAATGVDAWIMKIDTAGGVVWSTNIATSVNESLKFIEETGDGGFIACGFQSDSTNSNDVYLIKTDSVGNITWQKTFGGIDNDYADAVRQTSDGGYLISADTKSFGLPDYDIYMIKTDSAGNYEWSNLSGGPFADGCQGFIKTSANHYFTYGESIVNWNDPYQFFLQLTDSSGNVVWEKYPGGAGLEAGFNAVETPDGGFIVTGYSNTNDPNLPIDLVLFKINSQGDSLWSQFYGGPGIDIGYQIIPDIGGGYLVAGTTWNNDNDFYLLKVNDLGLITSKIELNEPTKIKVFPNPNNGSFNIFLEKLLENVEIKLFDLYGNLVFRKLYYKEYQIIELNCVLENGIYTLELESEGEIFRNKILVNN